MATNPKESNQSPSLKRMVSLLAELQSREETMKAVRHATHRCVGNEMYALRESSGLSLRETARRLKCSAPFLSDMEHGRRGQSIEWARKIADVHQLAASVEEDGDEIFTPMPRSCQRFACKEHHPKLKNKKGFMCCPRCGVSYGAAKQANEKLTQDTHE